MADGGLDGGRVFQAGRERSAPAVSEGRGFQGESGWLEWQTLHRDGEQDRAELESAKAQLEAAEAQARVISNSSEYAVLLADADGVIVRTLSEPGQVVAAGQTVIQLAHDGPREALINLPEGVRPD